MDKVELKIEVNEWDDYEVRVYVNGEVDEDMTYHTDDFEDATQTMAVMKKNMKVWLGPIPEKCDICKGNMGTVFYDCKTKSGPWGNLCHSCFKVHGIRLGYGFGQKYRTKNGIKIGG